MTAPARKTKGRSGSRKPSVRASTKRTRANSSARTATRVRVLESGEVVVLSTDAELRRQIIDSIKNGPVMKRALAQIRAETTEALRAMLEVRESLRAGLRDAEQRREATAAEARAAAARQFEARGRLFDEMLKHGRAPTESEMAEALDSWL